MIFFMNVEISSTVICNSGKIYMLMTNLMALHQELISDVTWTLPQGVLKGCQVSWLQAVFDSMSLCSMQLTEQKHVLHRILVLFCMKLSLVKNMKQHRVCRNARQKH
jgi:hypothetical protein